VEEVVHVPAALRVLLSNQTAVCSCCWDNPNGMLTAPSNEASGWFTAVEAGCTQKCRLKSKRPQFPSHFCFISGVYVADSGSLLGPAAGGSHCTTDRNPRSLSSPGLRGRALTYCCSRVKGPECLLRCG
jgi:hypothetical protein